jgi:hypothetical protein
MNHSFDRAFLLGNRAILDERCSRAFLARLAVHAAEQARPGSAVAATGALAATR